MKNKEKDLSQYKDVKTHINTAACSNGLMLL